MPNFFLNNFKIKISLAVFLITIISYSFLNINEVYADFQPGEPIYVDDDNNSETEDGSTENPYNTIQEAVDAAVDDGDNTIFVKDGTYIENIDIDKNHLTITSENGAEAAIVQAKNSDDNVFEIKADYVKINGFTTKWSLSSGAGISLDNANFCKISNNIVLHNSCGIRLRRSGYNTLINNKMLDNIYNFYLLGIFDNHFDNNIDTTNTVNGKPIYYIQNANNQTYDSSTNAGVFYCISCNNITVKDLTLTKNGYGLFFWKTENSRIENIATSENIYGIRLRFSNNNTLANNTVSDNMFGIGLYYSDSSFLTNNIVSDSQYQEIYLFRSNSNALTNNTISDGEDGIYLYYSENNKIYHNNFVNNSTQLKLKNSTDNFFDNGYPSGGNYWSDYSGKDLFKGLNQDQSGKDGIGDTPYAFSDGQDKYPFMEESGWENPVDKTPPQISNISIEPNKLKPNQPSIIKAKVTDESEIVFVKAILSHLGQVSLFDNGESPDETVNDGFYTAQWIIPEGTDLGEYTLAIVVEDEFGNQAINNSKSFEVIPSYPSPEKYAPNLWFDSDESYYPIDPFFYADDINGISGEASKNNYLNPQYLPDEDKKKNKFTVFYHVAETEDETQWVYEYFFYYAYNKMPHLNEHYHDWEGVFVFVDKKTEKVERVIASAHGKWAVNNELLNPNFTTGEHTGIMIEGGSHANCTDRNNDGLFQWRTDITNGPFPFAWGIRNRTIEDKEHGYQIQSETYNPNLIKITGKFIDKFGTDEDGDRLKTFLYSPPLGLLFEIPRFNKSVYINLGGNPPEHPWINEAYDNPEKIIPITINYVRGKVQSKTHRLKNAIIAIFSEEPAFTFTDENGEFLINNIKPGSHDIVINLDGYAPYKQRFIIEEKVGIAGINENEIIVGVNGILNLIPENEAFKLKGTAKDSDGNIIVNSQINVYDKKGNKLFTTLTDKEGHYLFNLSSKDTYTVEVIQEDKIEISKNIKGAVGEELIVNLSIENPKLLKIQSIEKLKQLKNGNPFINQKIDQIIKSIQSGLNDIFWTNDTHLKEKDFQGRKVFLFELTATAKIKNYSRIIKKNRKKDKIPENLFETFDEVSNNLTKSDFLLSETILNETKKEIENLDKDKLNKKQKKLLKTIQKRIKKAEQYLKKTEKQRLKKNYSRSVYYSLKTWNSVVSTKKVLKKL